MIYPWQQSQWQLILSQLNEARLSHALLFYGQAGMGKYDFSISVAKKVLCLQPSNKEYCGECRSCQLFQSGTHPDFYDLSPEEKSKNIKIDQIRELVNKLNQSSQLGGYKVAIIHPADLMNRFAANALLKSLEEPAGSVLFILITEEPARLAATIVSRCQKLLFSVKNDSEVLDWLSHQMGSEINIKLLFSIAEKAPLKVLSLAELNYLSMRDELLKQLIQLKQKSIHPIAIAENYLKKEVAIMLMTLISLISDISRLQLGANKIVNEDCLTELKKLSQSITCAALQNYLTQILNSRKLFLSAIPVNVQLLLENILLEWVKLSSC